MSRVVACAILLLASSAEAGRRRNIDVNPTMTVRVALAELRGRPALDSTVLGLVRRGEQVEVVRSSADQRWIEVAIGGGDLAWIEARAVKAGAVAPEAVRRGSLRMREPATARDRESRPLNDDGFRRIEGRHDEGDAPRPTREEAPPRRRAPRVVVAEREQERPPAEASPTRRRRGEPAAEATIAKAAEPPLPPHGNNYVDVHVRLGAAIPQHRVATNGVSPAVLPAYEYSTTNLAAGVQLGYSRAAGRFRFHLDGKYLIATLGAVRYTDGTTLQLRDQNIGGGIAFGGYFPAAGGIDFRVRVGAESWLTQITPSAPPLSVASEIMIGMAAGVEFAMPAIFRVAGRPFGFRLLGGAIAPATQMQSAGMGTGAKAKTYGAYAGGALMAGLTRPSTRGQVSLEARYDYSMLLSRYSGVCTPNQDAMGTCRDMSVSDARSGFVSHVATLGIYYQY